MHTLGAVCGKIDTGRHLGVQFG